MTPVRRISKSAGMLPASDRQILLMARLPSTCTPKGNFHQFRPVPSSTAPRVPNSIGRPGRNMQGLQDRRMLGRRVRRIGDRQGQRKRHRQDRHTVGRRGCDCTARPGRRKRARRVLNKPRHPGLNSKVRPARHSLCSCTHRLRRHRRQTQCWQDL